MKSIFAMLCVGFLSCVLTVECESIPFNDSMQDQPLFYAGCRSKKTESEPGIPIPIIPTHGYAILSTFFDKPFPLNNKVRLRRLPIHSKDIKLTRGTLKVPAGTYRFSYGINLQNTGGQGQLTAWLTARSSHLELPIVLTPSTSIVPVKAADGESGFSVFQVYRSIIVKVARPSFISINYSTTGNPCLFSLPPFSPCCHGLAKRTFRRPPIPFYLTATKL